MEVHVFQHLWALKVNGQVCRQGDGQACGQVGNNLRGFCTRHHKACMCPHLAAAWAWPLPGVPPWWGCPPALPLLLPLLPIGSRRGHPAAHACGGCPPLAAWLPCAAQPRRLAATLLPPLLALPAGSSGFCGRGGRKKKMSAVSNVICEPRGIEVGVPSAEEACPPAHLLACQPSSAIVPLQQNRPAARPTPAHAPPCTAPPALAAA